VKGTFKDHLVTWVEELLLHIHNKDKAKVNWILDDID
jgi:TorA maturation chaperone TorD